MFDVFKSHRRKALRAEPFPEAWRTIVAANVPYVATLRDEHRRELEGHVQVLLDEKRFEGCAGLEITDEIRAIASRACRLLLHREAHYFPDLEVVLVYPHAYVAANRRQLAGGVSLAEEQARLGQSASGVVVLA